MISITKKLLSILAIASISSLCFADVAVIINPNNSNQLKATEIRQIFLGKTHVFPNGQQATAFDLPDGNPNKALFAEHVLRKSISSLNSYWSRMLFSSKGKPPQALSAEAVKETVAKNQNAIAYIDSKDVDSSVKVLLTLP